MGSQSSKTMANKCMMKEASHISSAPVKASKLLFVVYIQIRMLKLSTNSRGRNKSHHAEKAISYFLSLYRKGPSFIYSRSVLRVLQIHAGASSTVEGKQIHALIIRLGFDQIIFLQTTLINLYSHTGNISDAKCIFDCIPQRNLICWTALISAYVNNARPKKALELFRQMQLEGIEPDQVTTTVALAACSDLGALDTGEWIHAYVSRKKGFAKDLILSNALINMYAKCGDIETSKHLFNTANKRDVMTWTSMIVGHALHGQADKALKLFAELKDHNGKFEDNRRRIIPNKVTFVGVLMACSHAGLVEEARHHLESMSRDYGLKPQISHYGCMVDLFCRAGLLELAFEFIKHIPIQPNAVLWRTLLGACSLRGDFNLAVQARRMLLELEPDYVGDDVVMSNTYAAAGLWDEKENTRKMLIKRRRKPGCSSIEVDCRIHQFIAADQSHPQRKEIYMVLTGIFDNLRASLYVADCWSSDDDYINEEQEKEST